MKHLISTGSYALLLSFWSHLVFIISTHTQEIRQQPYPEQGGPPPRTIKHAIIEQNNTDHHVLSSMFVFFPYSICLSEQTKNPNFFLPLGVHLRSRMFQELHLQRRSHQVTGFSREVPQQPGLHIHDLCSQDVGDCSGVRELWAGARHAATHWSVLPLRPPGDLGWLPWRWVIGEICCSKQENLSVWNKRSFSG